MSSRRTFILGSLAASALPMLPARASLAPSTVVKVGLYSRTIFFLPMSIAQDKGFFQDVGIAFELVPVPTIQKTVEALLDGTAPVAMVGPEVSFLDRKGRDRVRIIAGNVERLPHFLIAQPRFHSLTDLKGATFGVISETEGTTFVVQRMAAAAGLARSDYKIAAVGSAPARVKLLDEGKIDAALQPFPLSYQAEAKGFSNLGWAGSIVPDWQFGVMTVNRAWLAANRAAAAKLIHASIRGRHFMDEHPAEAAEIAAMHLEVPVALARRALDDALRLKIMDRDFHWSELGLTQVYGALQETGRIPATDVFRADRYVDPGPLSQAMRMFGR